VVGIIDPPPAARADERWKSVQTDDAAPGRDSLDPAVAEILTSR
jgi:hypothetical protein